MSGFTHLMALRFQPLLPAWCLWVLSALCLAAVAVSLWRSRRVGNGGGLLRGSAFALLILWLAGPMLMREQWRSLPETLLLALDETGSMQVGNRAAIARNAALAVQRQAQAIPGLSVQLVPITGSGAQGGGTRLLGAIERAAAGIPQAEGGSRIAGVVAITDGQAHDVPAALPADFPAGNAHVPLHVLIPASGEQTDRRLRVLQAPPFGIVGQDVTLRVEIEDLGPGGRSGQPATLTLRRDGEAPLARDVVVGTPQDITVPVTRPGPMLLSLSASPLDGEVSALNNDAVVQVNGVRDRLRVLLISGAPNQGERVWRRLLKADPSVDLVHFTILRPPDKDDTTPLNELALIAFPVRELFQEKIDQFDLIILDGFENRGILPLAYLRNIADFVRQGGGLLLTAGPELIGPGSLQETPLGDILPVHVPEAGGLVEERFQPMPTALGRRHPVTAGLPQMPAGAVGMGTVGAAQSDAGWGPWYRALRSDPPQAGGGAEVLMTGPQGGPLLVLDHVEQGRVAMLLSDQMWLWSRGEGGGGPQSELLRRLAHWLMKEPELEEEQLTARIEEGRLSVTRRSAAVAAATTVTVTAPDGSRHPLSLTTDSAQGGEAKGGMEASQPGVWSVSDGRSRAFAAARPPDPLEIADLRATATVLAPLVQATGGSTHWLGDTPDGAAIPSLRMIGPGERTAAGAGWIGLRRQGAHAVTGVQAARLLPGYAALPLVLLLLLLAWRREGRA